MGLWASSSWPEFFPGTHNFSHSPKLCIFKPNDNSKLSLDVSVGVNGICVYAAMAWWPVGYNPCLHSMWAEDWLQQIPATSLKYKVGKIMNGWIETRVSWKPVCLIHTLHLGKTLWAWKMLVLDGLGKGTVWYLSHYIVSPVSVSVWLVQHSRWCWEIGREQLVLINLSIL